MSKLASLCSRVTQGSFPKVLLIFRWARAAFSKPFVGVPVFVGGGAHLESTGRQGWGLPRNRLSEATTVLGVASPLRCPLPTPQSSLAPLYLFGMHGSTNGS